MALLSIFLFKNTLYTERHLRRKDAARCLVVDRCTTYNKLPVKLQYCYEHLIRDLEKLEKDFLDEEEVRYFVVALIPLLSQAMHIGSQDISDKEYYRNAKKLKEEIMTVCRRLARHLGIRSYQHIFTTHEGRFFQWVRDRWIPAHNNLAERELRSTVIATKVRFGSSSDAEAETPSILMSVLHTLNPFRVLHLCRVSKIRRNEQDR